MSKKEIKSIINKISKLQNGLLDFTINSHVSVKTIDDGEIHFIRAIIVRKNNKLTFVACPHTYFLEETEIDLNEFFEKNLSTIENRLSDKLL